MAPVLPFELRATDSGWCGRFSAMASPCEVLIDGGSAAQAHALVALAWTEATRIERKFSRYREGSVVTGLHAQRGRPVAVDDETALLLDFAARCHALSDGLFDITSGVLRAAWRFDGQARLPDAQQVQALCERVGWHRVTWQRPWFTLPAGMEVDLGGIGKEYAVDRTLALLREHSLLPLLVNFGGDLAVTGLRTPAAAPPCPWQVGIERPQAADRDAGPGAARLIALSAGALATSGDARRHLLHDGVRYGHILNPRTGWPVRDAPRSVTVAAPTCTEAGLLSTLAMLKGPGAQQWLEALQVPHWVLH